VIQKLGIWQGSPTYFLDSTSSRVHRHGARRRRIHITSQESEFCQILRARFSILEAGPIPMNKADAEDWKDRDARERKNRFLTRNVYKIGGEN